MAESDERTVVKTYVPASQKEVWEDQAASLDMTQSEFVRTMVQAGRRDFEFDAPEARSEPSNPQGETLEDRVVAILNSGGPLAWDELYEQVTEDIEERLEQTLEALQSANVIHHNPREGGYEVREQ